MGGADECDVDGFGMDGMRGVIGGFRYVVDDGAGRIDECKLILFV